MRTRSTDRNLLVNAESDQSMLSRLNKSASNQALEQCVLRLFVECFTNETDGISGVCRMLQQLHVHHLEEVCLCEFFNKDPQMHIVYSLFGRKEQRYCFALPFPLQIVRALHCISFA